MTTKHQNAAEQVSRTSAPRATVTYMPDVDIIADSERIRLIADLPGTAQSGVDVTVENNVLTINATAEVTAPEGFTLAGQEYGIGNYHRDFTLTDAVQTDGITAKVKGGVLEVIIPKREEVKTRRIKIE